MLKVFKTKNYFILVTLSIIINSHYVYAQSNFSEELLGGETIEMIFVDGGSFVMGCTAEQENYCRDNEKPAHKVTLNSFYIGKYPVTQRQFIAIMGETPSRIKGCDDCPVENINFFEVQEFIKELNKITGKQYRLPTEAEWEFAARGGNKSRGYIYSGGNNLSEVGWYDDTKVNKMQPVGLKRPNELGIYDMSGNVWEWCENWFENYCEKEKVNPKGPERGRFKVLRGGSWTVTKNNCRVSSRHRYFPNIKTFDYGFRLALDSKQ